MPQKLLSKKWLFVLFFLICLFLSLSIFSFVFIKKINKQFISVEGMSVLQSGCQQLIKQELTGHSNPRLEKELDQLITRIRDINKDLNNSQITESLRVTTQKWQQIRALLKNTSTNKDQLYVASEDFFYLVDDMLNIAAAESLHYVNDFLYYQILANILFLALILYLLIYAFRLFLARKHSKSLNQIAYFDLMTGLPNRAHCNKIISSYEKSNTDKNLAVFMFDMNSLKRVNDKLGHQAGDNIIITFASILREELQLHGFVCRYGGDEFLAILPEIESSQAEQYLKNIEQRIFQYNSLQTNSLKTLSAAMGYSINNLKQSSLAEMIYIADQKMYIDKREKKNALKNNKLDK